MPYVFITATPSHNPYESRSSIVEQPYTSSQLFKKYLHLFTGPKTGDIYIYKENSYAIFSRRNMGILLTREYDGATINKVYVYFNSYEKETPLILVIIFSGKSTAKARYYPYSKISPLIDNSELKIIDQLNVYDTSKNDEQLLGELIKENDNLTKLLTYQIDKRESGNYNKSKITISKKELKGKNHDTTHGFCKYTHTPTGSNALNNSCLLYNQSLLVGSDKKPIETIQNVKYNDVYVYFGSTVNEPLLVEFHSSYEENENKFYYHTRTNEGTLYWNEIKKGERVLNITFDRQNTIYRQLTDESNNKLIKLLNDIKTNLFKTLFLMIDRKTKYSVNDVIKSLTYSKNYRLINNEITPSDKTTSSEGSFIKNSGFKVFEHDFTSILGNFQDGELAQLKFILPSSYNSNTHTELTLYDTNNNTLTLCHKRGNTSKFYVYFYESDPRPLLFCYNDIVYRPSNKDDFFTNWNRISSVTKCPFGNETDNLNLLKCLSQVVACLNDIKLEDIPHSNSLNNSDESSSDPITHDVQRYNNQFIQVKVTYENKSCYRVYTHTPNGINGKGDGYRLGEIKYKDSSLNYEITKPLLRLLVYYNLYDSKHQFPLLLILEFKDNKEKEYYKLVKRGDSDERTWSKFQGAEEEAYLNKVKTFEEEIEKLINEIKSLKDEIKSLESQIKTSESQINSLKKNLESNKGEESTILNSKTEAQTNKRTTQNGDQSESPEKTDEEKLKEEDEKLKNLNQEKDNKLSEKSGKEKTLEEKKEDLKSLLEQKAYWIMRGLGITFNKDSPLFNPDKCKENNTSKGLIVGTLSTLGLTFGGIGGAIYKYPEAFMYVIRQISRYVG